MDHSKRKCKRHDLTLEKLQKARNEWNENRMKRLNFINKRLSQNYEARACKSWKNSCLSLWMLNIIKTPKK